MATKVYTRQSSPSPDNPREGASPAAEPSAPPPQAAPAIPHAPAAATAKTSAAGSTPKTSAAGPAAKTRAAGPTPTPAANAKEYLQLDPGAQYVPAPKPPTLIEILPVEYQTTRPPLLYRLSTVSEPARPDGRIAQSRTYRARAFSCGMFYKPISRCLVDWEDR